MHDRQLWSAQTSSDLKLPQESDSDSINDYAGGTVGEFGLLYTNFFSLQCKPLIIPCTLKQNLLQCLKTIQRLIEKILELKHFIL